ncbi:MAG: hypothetical protein HYS86_01975 [Candidatus Chisholmbacteria bacterium]|nr:hypothetical protein [Candidatus Chisholmbacteria bacterium]
MENLGLDMSSPESPLRLIHFIPRDNIGIQTGAGRIDLSVDTNTLEADIASRLPAQLRSPHDVNVYFGARLLAEVLVENFGGDREDVRLRQEVEDFLFGATVGLFTRGDGRSLLYFNTPKLYEQVAATPQAGGSLGVFPRVMAEAWAHEATHLLQALDPDPDKDVLRQQGMKEEHFFIGGAAISSLVLGGLAGVGLGRNAKSHRRDEGVRSPSRRRFLRLMAGTFAGLASAPLAGGAAGSAHYQWFNEAEKEAREAAKDQQRIDFLRRAFTVSRSGT